MNRGGLKYKLIKLQLTLTMVVLTISWSLITINDYYLFKSLTIQSFETTARILARNLSTCLAFKDQEECHRVLKTLSGEEDVLKAVVFDANDEKVSTYLRNESVYIESQPELSGNDFQIQIKNKFINSTYPIYDAGILEGRLFIVSKFDLIWTFVERHVLFFLLVMVGNILVGVLLSNHFQRQITGQINIIIKTIDNIRHQKNYKLRTVDDISFGEVKIDEFKQLATSFDDMIEQIEIRDASLQTKNDGLKKLVEEKVDELYKEKERAIHKSELASLGEMAGGIAHEINNPLAIIKSSTSALSKMMKRENIDKEIVIDCVQDIDQTVERIAKIITGLRNISRRSEDEEKVICKFQDIFDDVFGLATVKFNAKGIEFRKNFSPNDLTRTFLANRIQLSQVLVNLLNNAYDAISDLNEKWIEVQLEFDSKMITLKITDSGNGIPLAIREKMFNPFYTTKEIGKGTGIGLSISKSIVEKNGGIFFYDEQCSNTRFVIQIPFEGKIV